METTNKQAIIVLHEIYGINGFINGVCRRFEHAGFDVFCPNLVNRGYFDYTESEQAYEYFMSHVGFDVYKDISKLIEKLSAKYDKVFVIGFSVGATLAWLCSTSRACAGVLACYGSRIRDYTQLNPTCSAILIFAKNDTFDVGQLLSKLQDKPNLELLELSAGHGFMDGCSVNYDCEASNYAWSKIFSFLEQR